MVEKLSGVYTTTDTQGFVPDQAVARGAIGMIGHMISGSGLLAQIPEASRFSTANPFGVIFEFNNIIDVKRDLGGVVISGSTWIDGAFGSSADGGGYDEKFNLLRALELVYLGNPNAKCYVAVLSGSGTNPSTISDGTAEALAELMKKDDIEFFGGAGIQYNATYLAHATASDDDESQAERIYVAGVSLNEAYSGSSGVALQNVFDVDAFLSFQEDTGRSIFFIGNSNFQFQTAIRSGTAEASKEIGGEHISAFLMGLMSSYPSESVSILNKGVQGFLPVYNGNPKIWSFSELETNFDNAMISVRFNASNSPPYYFEKGMTFNTGASAFNRITKRRIIDRVLKDVRVTLRAEVGKPNIESRRRAVNDRVLRVLKGLLEDGILQGTVSSVVFVQEGDAANGILRCNLKVTPVGETEEVRLTVGVIF